MRESERAGGVWFCLNGVCRTAWLICRCIPPSFPSFLPPSFLLRRYPFNCTNAYFGKDPYPGVGKQCQCYTPDVLSQTSRVGGGSDCSSVQKYTHGSLAIGTKVRVHMVYMSALVSACVPR